MPPYQRIDIRPVQLKAGLHWQCVSHDGKKDITKNLPLDQLNLGNYLMDGYANLIVENDVQQFNLRVTKSGKAEFGFTKVSRDIPNEISLSHDRIKIRLLDETDPIFIALGISDNDGVLKPTRTDKFKQVQEFLKNIVEVLPEVTKKSLANKAIKIVDLGCGHAYLTFAAYKYLKNQGFAVSVIGVDERTDSRERNSQIAQQLGVSGEVKFEAKQISNLADFEVDVAIALHACDTATDDAIAWAVKNNARAILVAPCCQHDIQRQMQVAPAPWSIATRHGILHERLGDLITDSLRAQILRILGYKTEIIEFIAGSHTPKNLMIRAMNTGVHNLNRTPAAKSDEVKAKEFAEYDLMLQQWGITPKLQELLAAQLDALR
ncbi:MAG: SAM-dependent methyltransferase [Candidatus Nanopelagicaceae bacterium]|nr:SAM-dependent methyltransferase [Candidatus Nanopelagicaceae bacterium]